MTIAEAWDAYEACLDTARSHDFKVLADHEACEKAWAVFQAAIREGAQ